VKALDESI
jgi:hypothetical protein